MNAKRPTTCVAFAALTGKALLCRKKRKKTHSFDYVSPFKDVRFYSQGGRNHIFFQPDSLSSLSNLLPADRGNISAAHSAFVPEATAEEERGTQSIRTACGAGE